MSMSRSSSARASEIRSPERHSTAINARLRTPVGARLEHALMSAIASGSVSTSGGRRRDPDAGEVGLGRVALTWRRSRRPGARQRRARARERELKAY